LHVSIRENTGKLLAVFNQDPPAYSKGDLLFSNTMNYRSSTGPNLHGPKSCSLVEAIVWAILALWTTHLAKYWETDHGFQPRPTTP
jgi:hypothetical protein